MARVLSNRSGCRAGRRKEIEWSTKSSSASLSGRSPDGTGGWTPAASISAAASSAGSGAEARATPATSVDSIHGDGDVGRVDYDATDCGRVGPHAAGVVG